MYDIGVFNSIISTNSSFVLHEKVVSNIEILHKLMGVQQDIITRKTSRDTADMWKKQEAFKVTVVSKLEGIDQIIGDIKKHMNKLTATNYDTNLNKIIDLTDKLIEKDINCITQIIDILVSVSCNNKYYSKLYAKIYMNMINKDECFVNGKQEIINEYLHELTNIVTVDPNVDYDKFCEANKQNEQRRSRLLFIIHLYTENGYNSAELINIMNVLNEMINDKRNDKINVELVNEITEDVNVFVVTLVKTIKTDNEFTFILDKVREYSVCNIKEYPGISGRVKFKYMDMIDLFK